MPDLERITDRKRFSYFQPGGRLKLFIVTTTEPRRCPGVSRQQGKKFLQALSIESEIRRQLPQNRPELFAQGEDTRSEKICQRFLNVAQLFHVCNKTRRLNAKQELRWRLSVPTLVAGRQLQRVERSVDLHGVECSAGELQLTPLSQVRRVKFPAPAWVTPTRDPDPQLAVRFRDQTS